MRNLKQITIFELVQAVQDVARSDDEVVAVLAHLLKTIRVIRPLRAAA